MPEALLRRVSHAERLGVGQRICAGVLEKFKEDVLAVLVTGSTAKSIDRPFSDLEMAAVVKDSVEVSTKYYVHDGLLVQLDYLQESRLLREARGPTRNWPIAADGYRNRIVLFERDGWCRRLDEAVAECDRGDFVEAVRFAALAMTESLAAFRNAGLEDNLLVMRSHAVYYAADAGSVVFLLNRRYVLTTSWFWKQLFECPEQPRELKRLVEVIVGLVPSSKAELAEAVETLWKETMNMVEARGISIESSEIIV